MKIGFPALPALVLLAGCAKQPFYEPVGFWDARSDLYDQELLPLLVEEQLERGRIRELRLGDPSRDGAFREVDAAELAELPGEVLFAAHACSTRRSRGGEFDLLVHSGGDTVPITVWSSVDGALLVARGDAAPAPPAPPLHGDASLWRQDLARAYGLVRVEDAGGSWSLTDLGDLQTALELLTPAERLALEGLALGRGGTSPRMPKRELAFYDPRTVPPRIDFFDLSFEAFESGFVGPVGAPVRAPVMTLLHEFGHALADLPMRRAWERYVELDHEWRGAADPAAMGEVESARRTIQRDLRHMGLRGPVIDAYQEVRGRQRGPTSWAWRQVHESFAEAFALYHVDPDALHRVMPDVHEWFAAGGHVSWLDARDAIPRARNGAGKALVE